MAEAEKITFKVAARLAVSDETAERCLRLLEMWQDDNPDKNIIVDVEDMEDGSLRHKMRIVPFGLLPCHEQETGS